MMNTQNHLVFSFYKMLIKFNWHSQYYFTYHQHDTQPSLQAPHQLFTPIHTLLPLRTNCLNQLHPPQVPTPPLRIFSLTQWDQFVELFKTNKEQIKP